jgi:hypothetical protein
MPTLQDCQERNIHTVDNQGGCHFCGKILDPDYYDQYFGNGAAKAQTERMVKEVTDQVWNSVFQILDAHQYLNGEEAGSMAQSASDVVKQQLLKYWS